jgi:hypothetical protein
MSAGGTPASPSTLGMTRHCAASKADFGELSSTATVSNAATASCQRPKAASANPHVTRMCAAASGGRLPAPASAVRAMVSWAGARSYARAHLRNPISSGSMASGSPPTSPTSPKSALVFSDGVPKRSTLAACRYAIGMLPLESDTASSCASQRAAAVESPRRIARIVRSSNAGPNVESNSTARRSRDCAVSRGNPSSGPRAWRSSPNTSQP